MLDLNESNRKDTTLMGLLPGKLQTRLEECLIDIDDLEIDIELGKGTGVVSNVIFWVGEIMVYHQDL